MNLSLMLISFPCFPHRQGTPSGTASKPSHRPRTQYRSSGGIRLVVPWLAVCALAGPSQLRPVSVLLRLDRFDIGLRGCFNTPERVGPVRDLRH